MLTLYAVVCCASWGAEGASTTAPDFTGFVTALQAREGVGRIWVESHADKLVRRHVVVVTRKTVIVRREDNIERPAALHSVEKGKWLQVWFAEPTAARPPVEVTARKIAIVPRS